MNHNHFSEPYSAQRPRIPILVWVATAGLVLALIAVFVFNIAWSTVGYFGLIAFFVGSHFFMHGGHGTHNVHEPQSGSPAKAVDGPVDENQSESQHSGHSGGCCH